MWELMPWTEYRRLAVQESYEKGLLPTARRLGIGRNTLYRWRREVGQETEQAARALAAQSRTSLVSLASAPRGTPPRKGMARA